VALAAGDIWWTGNEDHVLDCREYMNLHELQPFVPDIFVILRFPLSIDTIIFPDVTAAISLPVMKPYTIQPLAYNYTKRDYKTSAHS
jgi:hypothetical protein